MEYVENYEPSGDGYEVPDTPHMEIMFDALEHTAEIVDGTESLVRHNNLTEAQHYAIGVLNSAGIVIPGSRHGMEDGIFTSIGNGFAAVWDYIKKTFKSIWDFFFSRDSAKEADDAKKDVEGTNKDLKDAAAGTQSDEEAAKTASKMAGVAEGAAAEELKKAKTPAERKKAIKAALAQMPKMNKGATAKLTKTKEAAVNAKKAFTTAGATDKEKAAAGQLEGKNHPAMQVLMDMNNDVAKFVMKDKAFLTQLEGVLSITTPQAAISFGDAAKKNIDDLQALSKAFESNKGKIQTAITQTEAKMKKAKSAGDKKELTAEVGALRALMVGATRYSKLISANFTRVKAAHKDLAAVFCL